MNERGIGFLAGAVALLVLLTATSVVVAQGSGSRVDLFAKVDGSKTLVLRFEGKSAPVDVLVCFKCGDMLILRNKKALSKLGFSPVLRREFLNIGRLVAPDDEAWKPIETELNE